MGWLQKFDQDMYEKQLEEEELQKALDEEKVELDKLQVQQTMKLM